MGRACVSLGAACRSAHQTAGREAGREAAATARFAVDQQIALVAAQHMLDDGQPQPGAAGLPRAAPVHPVEALGEARDVVGGDADLLQECLPLLQCFAEAVRCMAAVTALFFMLFVVGIALLMLTGGG